ncbi:hypothetical protein KKB83_05335 [Patescibacteria group bacterium]|nr:hypothetical protein [Patescibacteria group bacterium]
MSKENLEVERKMWKVILCLAVMAFLIYRRHCGGEEKVSTRAEWWRMVAIDLAAMLLLTIPSLRYFKAPDLRLVVRGFGVGVVSQLLISGIYMASVSEKQRGKELVQIWQEPLSHRLFMMFYLLFIDTLLLATIVESFAAYFPLWVAGAVAVILSALAVERKAEGALRVTPKVAVLCLWSGSAGLYAAMAVSLAGWMGHYLIAHLRLWRIDRKRHKHSA